jgi:hypothetical protein
MEARMSFTAEDKAVLKAHADWGKKYSTHVSDHFYEYLGRDEEMNGILQQEGRMDRLHQTFIEWFEQMFTGIDDWGSEYAKRRWRIGLIHVRIGIGPQHVVPAMAAVVREIEKLLKADGKNGELKESLAKICMIDLAFIEQAYIEVTSNAVLQETGWSEGLFKRLIKTGASSM